MTDKSGQCATIAEAIESIESTEELRGFVEALNDPILKTKPVSKSDREAIARLKIALVSR